jgi:hypothetical protein
VREKRSEVVMCRYVARCHRKGLPIGRLRLPHPTLLAQNHAKRRPRFRAPPIGGSQRMPTRRLSLGKRAPIYEIVRSRYSGLRTSVHPSRLHDRDSRTA